MKGDTVERKGIAGLLLGGFVVMALLLAGCGGGDDETALTKAQFVRQGNAICKSQTEAREKILSAALKRAEKQKAFTKAEKEEAIVELMGPYEEMTAELKDLGAPQGDEKQVEAITEAMEEAAAEVEKNPAKAT